MLIYDTLWENQALDEKKKVLQYLLYGLNIPSAKSESNRMLRLGTISAYLTLSQKLQTEKSSILDIAKGKRKLYSPGKRVTTKRRLTSIVGVLKRSSYLVGHLRKRMSGNSYCKISLIDLTFSCLCGRALVFTKL